ncbi:MAG: hypothetical protein IJ284_03550 [Clostridia bacterium]|nr:hypothetical protein [Clostridia bacterium]
MIDNKIYVETNGVRLAYEQPRVEVLCWENDILATQYSTDVGGQFPTSGDNNWN